MPNRALAASLILVAFGVACEKPPPPQLRVLQRLVEQQVRRDDRRAISVPGFVGLDDVRRPVLSASKSMRPVVTCPGEPAARKTRHHRCRVAIPRSAPRAAAWIIETAPIGVLRATAKRAAGRKVRSPTSLDRRAHVAVRADSAGAASADLPAWLTDFARAWPAPAVPARDFLSRPFLVPPGAVLTFAIGTEEPAWHVDAPAVEFSIEARHPGGAAEIFRRVLDPSHRPADRGWHDETVSLAAVEGKSIRLRLKVRPAAPGNLAPQLPVWADPTILAPAAPTEPRRPSVVLVSLDTLRAKSVSAFGYGLPTTPFLERFSRRATRFSNAFTTFSNTFGSHMSMLTGAYPSTHVHAGAVNALSPEIETLAQRLRANGYSTAAFTEDALLDATAGFENGFSRYWENKTVDTGAGDAPGTFARALDWLATHRNEPVFLFAHTYAVHAPYKPSPPYDTMFATDEPGRPKGALLAYEQEIRQLDDVVAGVVADLDRLLDPRETLLVVTADHGEEFGEHSALSHVQLYDEVLRIPLWVRWPGRVPAGRDVETLVSLVDVTPTILDLVGLDDATPNGLSFAPLLRGDGEGPTRPMVLAESPPSLWSNRQWSYVARTRTAKCFALEDRTLDRCYDLVADPGESTPAAASPDRAGLAKVARVFADLATKARGGKPHGPQHGVGPENVDPERVEKLRALGYVE